MSPRKPSTLTATDQFCGAGGSSIGIVSAGAELRMALNHWKLAVETHASNFPTADHDCTDISATDPRRYPSTDVLITSPECTTHSPAGGSRRSKPQRDLFIPASEDAATARSRATMWDVPRFAEFHKYNAIIVENVVEAYTQWPLFHTWLQAMDVLGYSHEVVCANSMFYHPTPQSRDRLYIVFWRKGNRKPNLTQRPPAYCWKCDKDVGSRQTWKNGRTVGKYRTQYIYTCPDCRAEVKPYYFAGLNCLDLSIPGQRIGDRKTPLKPRTMERIRYGLDKYGRQALLVTTNQTNRLGGRVRSVSDPCFTQPGCAVTGFVSPAFLVDTTNTHSKSRRHRGLEEPTQAVTGQASAALIGVPFMVTAGSNESISSGLAPVGTQTGTERFGVVTPGAIVKLRGGEASHLRNAKGLDAPVDTLSSGGNHYLLVAGAAQISLRDADAMRVAGLDEELRVQGTKPQAALISLAPFISSQYGQNQASSAADALPTQMGNEKHALISPAPFISPHYGMQASGLHEPTPTQTAYEKDSLIQPVDELNVEDCYFRMLQPHEIGAAMAFPGDYIVLGNKRDKVKQFGNAVTPPVMSWLFRAVAESLEGDIAA